MVAAEIDARRARTSPAARCSSSALIINATGPTTLRFLPPLIVTEAEIDEALRRLRRAARLSRAGLANIARAVCNR